MRVVWLTRSTDPLRPTAQEQEVDAFVLSAASGHVLQTRAWADVARADGGVAARLAVVYDGDRIAGTALVQRPRVAGVPLLGALPGPWAWIERGPVVARVDDLEAVMRAL